MSNPKSITITSFTSRYNGLSNVLVNDVFVSSKLFHPTDKKIDLNALDTHSYKALWDTGATNCVITQKIIDDLKLKPIGMTKVNTASHVEVDAEIYIVSILLPNKICVPNVRVTKGNISGHDLLIGMDIINRGDFAVTHNKGKTSFSFRMPSVEEIDFTKQPVSTPTRIVPKVPRNIILPRNWTEE